MEVFRRATIEPSEPPRRPAIATDEVELIDYLRVLWRWWVLVVGGTLAIAAVTLVVSLLLPKFYEARATLMVVRSKFGSEELQGPHYGALTAKTYESIVKNRGAIADAIKTFSLSEPPHRYATRHLERRVDVAAVPNTNLVTLSVELKDPQRAADVANYLTTRAIELNGKLNEGEMGDSRSFLETQVQHASVGLAESERALESFKREAQLEIVSKDLEIRLAHLAEWDTERARVLIGLANVTGDLASLEAQLQKQPKTVKTSRALVEDPAYQQALATLARADVERLVGVTMQSEVLNPTYSFIESRLAESRREAGGLAARKRELDRLIAQNTPQLEARQRELTEKTMQLDRLQRTYDLARDSYKGLRARLEATNVEVASKSNLLKLVEAALPPEQHVRPRRVVNTAVAGVLGLLVMVGVAFLVDYVRRAARDDDGAR